MAKISFNDKWMVRPLSESEKNARQIDLPFDAMLYEEISSSSEGGVNSAWFVGGDYVFSKTFIAPIPNNGKAILEMEGVYRDAEIYLNKQRIFVNNYGYNDFYVDLTLYLKDGENVLEVISHNSDQPNSRWYTGAGIYRPVWLYLLNGKHVIPGSERIETLSYKDRKIKVAGEASYDGTLSYQILDQDKKEVAKGEISIKNGAFAEILQLDGALLWDDENPNLYTLNLISEDGELSSIRFGIRQIEVGQEGFLVNGKRVLLKGACIHHDHGILGARAYPDADYRRIRLLKDAGYNAIRSAHNPISKATLDACDELGMYVMDEYADSWYIHKTKYDYASHLMDNYKEDLRLMVIKDFNHPSVIMYSIGNEVAETSQKKGIALAEELTNTLHFLDPTRFVTCGINIFFNALFSMGFGVYSEEKAESNSQAKAKKKETGSAFFNKITNFLGSNVMKVGSTLPICDRKTRGTFSKLDVCGYNYALNRYKHDHRKYPNRIIVGSETFVCDPAKWLRIAKKYPRVIGDFVWSGLDYLGECGIGSWINEEDAPSFDHGPGWISAGAGRIDITGRFLGEALFTQVQYGVKPIALAVVSPKECRLKHSPSAWKYSLAMPYFDFPKEEEGKKCYAEIYCNQSRYELYLDGALLKKGKCHKNGRNIVKFPYKKGKLEAVCFDDNNKEVGRCYLSSNDGPTKLVAKEEGRPSPNDRLYYVRLRLENEDGDIRAYDKDEILVEKVVGGELLGIGNGCPYHKERYIGNKCITYQGEALAIFRVDDEDSFSFEVKSKNYDSFVYKIDNR